MKNIILLILVLAALAGGFYFYTNDHKASAPNEVQKPVNNTETTDYKNATYVLEGNAVALSNGFSETALAPGSATRIITQYFGNDLHTDLNNDGQEDVVFLLTQDPGGSGTFWYVVAALNTENGYVGSTGYLLGDRIAPQTLEMSQSPNHKNVIVMNYFDHAADEPMTGRPTVAKSIWLKLDPDTMQFGEVVQDFEGEAEPSLMDLTMKIWVWEKVDYSDGNNLEPKKNGAFTITFTDDQTFSVTTDCNSMSGTYKTDHNRDINLTLGLGTLMECEGSQEEEFKTILSGIERYKFTTKGELVFDLEDDGLVYFR